MAEVSETTLPGVGVRYDFVTSEGVRIGVLVHRTGRRDLLVYSPVDPDACVAQLSFDPDDARTLAELLGATRIAESIAAVQQDIEGLSIDWIKIDEGSEWAGKRLSEAGGAHRDRCLDRRAHRRRPCRRRARSGRRPARGFDGRRRGHTGGLERLAVEGSAEIGA